VNPHFPEAWHNFGISLLTLGAVDEAAKAFGEALAHKPSYVGAHDALLLASLYRSTDLGRLLEEHRAWEKQHAEPLRARWRRLENDRDPERRLRVGYVSGDFRNHPVATFIEPLIAAHDRARVDVYCYSDVQVPDVVTARIRAHAQEWRDINGRTDGDVAAMVRADRIDILVDLSLHSGVNRLLVFARKVAPVQVSYLGYAFTPGLSAIDYRLTDEVLDPRDGARIGPEKAWRLPGVFCCYHPPADAPEVLPSPVEVNGHITLGSFNKLPKVTDQMLWLWARLLKEIPGARLLIQAQGADQASFAARIDPIFGCQSERVTRRGLQPMGEYLRTVSSVDVCAGYVSVQWSYHDVPCAVDGRGDGDAGGRAATGAGGRSLLGAVGLQEFAAEDGEAFVRVAAELSGDRARMVEFTAISSPADATVRPDGCESIGQECRGGVWRDVERVPARGFWAGIASGGGEIESWFSTARHLH
jgi:predicted O-linked N-acetylglucosamine transferase (SPINDLY family)